MNFSSSSSARFRFKNFAPPVFAVASRAIRVDIKTFEHHGENDVVCVHKTLFFTSGNYIFTGIQPVWYLA